jgi:hypothetical protein
MGFETLANVLLGYGFFPSPPCSALGDWVRRQGGGSDPRLGVRLDELGRSIGEFREEMVEFGGRYGLHRTHVDQRPRARGAPAALNSVRRRH